MKPPFTIDRISGLIVSLPGPLPPNCHLRLQIATSKTLTTKDTKHHEGFAEVFPSCSFVTSAVNRLPNCTGVDLLTFANRTMFFEGNI